LELEQQQQGIYNLNYGVHRIRLLVLNRMPREEQNALWQLFSGSREGFVYGSNYYNWHSMRDKAIINKLYEFYSKKGAVMPYTIDDFVREYVSENIHVLSAEEVLQKYSPEEVLKHYPTDKILEGLSPEKRLEGLSPEIIKEFLRRLENKNQ
jgi:hypothetical protein